ncbi:MAG: hypothetical protein D6731_16700 [Planctomycetota bacterium]|nr:MAG: hypothetical protein D6731_16700 [Planctomycetota bacterium]
MRDALVAARLALGTCRSVFAQPFAWGVLLATALLIPTAAAFTLFGLDARILLVREMGLGSCLLGGLFLVLFCENALPGEDLRSGEALSLLAGPVAPGAYVAGRLGGLGLALSLAHGAWALSLWGTLRLFAAGPFDAGLGAALLLGVLALLLLAATLQLLSLWLPAGAVLPAGVALYLCGQASELLLAAPAPFSWALSLLPQLGALDASAAAAAGEPLPAVFGAGALAYAVLFLFGVGALTRRTLVLRGACLP